jgi:hypothetical protein
MYREGREGERAEEIERLNFECVGVTKLDIASMWCFQTQYTDIAQLLQ